MPWKPTVSTSKLIHRVLIVDKSGSMANATAQVISGFNEQVQMLRTLESEYPDQKYIVTLVTFNHTFETLLYACPVNALQPLTPKSYVPDGGTALHDAIGLTMTRLMGEGRDELSDPNTSVLVTIFTDGEENASKSEFKDSAVLATLLDRLQKTEQFVFTFVGAQDVRETAQALGIPVSNTMSYQHTAAGTAEAYSTVSDATRSFSQRLASGAKGAALTTNFFDEGKDNDH